ncbi:sodium:solute symporter [Verminephrobacter aporrectodeae subsp. tuberculatae]|uniref:Sodium:solute symporter n=1 Tax=Verminephrobacter aporrectodeae subsp. tuberculatae TaxID=1110392 RepID=A0ABT3KQA0_9BURK|nr:sodium:solute symporter family protein [Verminephrobacter aporrectodeae]MCW5255504.1 sodium:solute symporter [Verminephrobacter aporrectodeae subsp. tuberculatae]MCW5320488.1 sodium:solute symporter [Verminephrobacter aporrectodeae subsp. tuberculatae]MCW8163769.1 sodium:solute symporter [Verminephrobacter aporrectodeae subsp. tuberculatae]MCW8168004.1 sodium:solute symporter [Verminephrobacter aporrectodeae subsp. tuberculatae]MCW8209046.1 sodium:solute symporter [Verminephrobacter aporrec
MLLSFIVLYLLASMAVGLYAARRVHNTADYAVAGRHLPLAMVIATTFATWFGSETVLGVSARFVDGGLGSVVEDPFGASMCLVLVGLFFASKLYQKNLITLGDYYRQRYGRVIEVSCSAIIIFSYLGWVAAQITALGLVFNLLTQGAVSVQLGMVIGILVVLIYTLYGGMWSVAMTDFVQMIVIGVGLLLIAWYAADLAGGARKVVEFAAREGKFRFFPEGGVREWTFFFAAGITMMLGSIPQQDVFQRVMSSNSAATARKGPVIGGLLYLLFAFIPMFVVTAAVLVMPETVQELLKEDPQKVLPMLVMERMPLLLQVAFFGALLSAIMSTASATLLAPSTTFVENILHNLRPGMNDQETLKAMRIAVLVFTGCVLSYAITMQGTSIYELVSGAYQVPLVGAFVPLVFGLYWKRATTQGALLAVAMGLGVWLLFVASPMLSEAFPQQLAGVLAALAGMLGGSLAPQWIDDHKGQVTHYEGSTA